MLNGKMLYPQITTISDEIARKYINSFLAEDSPNGDITSDLIFSGDEKSKAFIKCKSETVLAGGFLIKYFFSENTTVELLKKDGFFIKKGEIIAEIDGLTKEILRVERLFLNLLQRMCGIAYMAHQMYEIARPYGVEILDTRKTTPGLRIFEKYAVNAGGGCNHRYDLSSGIMAKDNHIFAAGGLANAINKLKNNKKLPIQIEVDNIKQLETALDEGIDAVLLDNFTPSETKKAVELIRNHKNGKDVYIESSGGIDQGNLARYVDCGIDAVSSGALTHSVKSADISLDFK